MTPTISFCKARAQSHPPQILSLGASVTRRDLQIRSENLIGPVLVVLCLVVMSAIASEGAAPLVSEAREGGPPTPMNQHSTEFPAHIKTRLLKHYSEEVDASGFWASGMEDQGPG